jgi:capsule polysaccharide export protein KpsC/LpsZ
MFDEPRATERYVLYPIHFQPEASTLVQAPLYLDQAALIEDISKSLPVGYQLYVKEHVSNRGRRPLGFYERLRRTFGVRLLGPDEDTWALIRNASAIAVITGTVGWEGLLFGKPVVTFGDVFYNDCALTHRAGLVPKDHWVDVFRKAIFDHEHDEDLLLEFVAAIQQSSRPGFMKNPNTFPEVLEPENVKRIAQALAWGVGLEPRSQ